MEAHNHDNPLRRQCASLGALCAPQLAGIKQGLAAAMPAGEMRAIRNVIVTGCGDSYLAARACIPAFAAFNKAFGNNFTALRCIDVARIHEFDPAYGPATLVVGVSASGGPVRVSEALRRAGLKGCRTLAVTNNPQSAAAQSAQYTLEVHTPAFPGSDPGLRNYYASLLALYALAAALGEAKGLCPAGTLEALFEAVACYTGAVFEGFDAVDSQMHSLAEGWQDCRAFEAVGDGIDYSSAFFMAAKLVEVTGAMAPATDSENWCHVNYFAHTPESIGTLMVANVHDNNRSRMAETLRQACGIGRPVLLVTNGTAADYSLPPGNGIQVCRLPDTPEGFPFLAPLLNHLPGSLLASYISSLREEPYFRGEASAQRRSAYGSSIGTSKLEIV